MGTFTRMTFSPVNGLKDKDVYAATPTTEDAAREQIQGISDQLKVYINDTLLADLENAETDNSGASRIGSQPIVNVNGTTVFDQINDLKSQLDTAVSEGFTTGSVGTDAIADDAVTVDKIAGNAVGEDQIIAGAVTESKLGLYAVSESKLAAGAVTTDKIGLNAVKEAKIYEGAVTETKLSGGAVTETKIAPSAKTDSVSTISSSKLATATAVKTAYDKGQAAHTLAETKENALNTDQKRKITISASSPSGGNNGDIWLEIIS